MICKVTKDMLRAKRRLVKSSKNSAKWLNRSRLFLVNLCWIIRLTADDRTPRSCRSSLAQMSLISMKSAGVCIARPVLLTSPSGRQEVLLAPLWTSGGFLSAPDVSPPTGVFGLARCLLPRWTGRPSDPCSEQPEGETRGLCGSAAHNWTRDPGGRGRCF